MKRKLRIAQYGCGKMSVYTMRYAIEKGAEIVCAFGRSSNIGTDIGDIAGIGKTGVLVQDSKDAVAIMNETKPDACIITTASLMHDVKRALMDCAESRVNAITLCEEAFYPWNSAPRTTRMLDELAKEKGVTLCGSGYGDVFWGNLVTIIAGSTHTITKITGRSSYNVEDYGIALAKAHGAGLSLEEFAQEIAAADDISDAERTALIEAEEFLPSYMWNSNGWLCSQLGITVKEQTQKCVPQTHDKELRSETLQMTIPAGHATGMSAVVTTTTDEGIVIEGNCIGKVYAPGEFDQLVWTIHGEPDTDVIINRPATVELTCATTVNRIPDLIAAPPGFITSEKMPMNKFRSRDLGSYVDLKVANILSLICLFAASIFAQDRPAVNGDRLNASLRELAEFGKTVEGGTNRVAYSVEDVAARQYVMGLMREAKLDVSIDVAGNIIGRRTGSDPSLKPLMIGSHIDSVPMGGSYDGQVGSMGAIEVARTLAERNITLKHPLIVVIFQNEEGGTTGSIAMARGLTPADLDSVSNSKKTVREGIRLIGGDPDKLLKPLLKKGDLAGYLELHIEQGGRLDQQKINIGVVEGIVGLRWFEITIHGFANHAGTTPMGQRQDSLLAAAKYIEAVNKAARSIQGAQVATVGKIQAFPGATNVVPGKVVTSLDVRDLDPAKIEEVLKKIRESVKLIEAETGTKFEITETASSHPALADGAFKAAIDASAKALGLTTFALPSGAGHDAQEIADICPVGMIFVPSRSGISHSPKEFTEPSDITNGANVLLQALITLDRQLAK